METSLKTGFAQNFLSLPKKSELPKIWGGCSPPRPPGPYAYGNKPQNVLNISRDTSNVASDTLSTQKKIVYAS